MANWLRKSWIPCYLIPESHDESNYRGSGVGKSTFIDKIGLHIIRDRGKKLAVLSVDPSVQ